MIYFPKNLTPVSKYPGYFWDVENHKLFSIKVAGELREMKRQRIHPAAFRHSSFKYTKLRPGDWVYNVSVKGRRRYLLVRDLKKLKLVDYHVPVIERKTQNED